MINFKRIRINFIISFILALSFLFYAKEISSLENKILFKIKDKAFTSFDYDNRIKYLDFVGNNNNLDKNTIMNDFISANLFYEYYKNSNSKIDIEKINEIYDNINKVNLENNKTLTYKIDKEIILENLKLDYVRKSILENILNSSLNNLKTSNEEIDLLYDIKIKYINVQSDNISKIVKEINKIKNINIDNIQLYLDQNNILYYINEKKINNIQNVNKIIRDNIIANKKFFIIEKKNKLSIIYIDKNFVTYEGMIANIFSVRSKNDTNVNDLKCKNLNNNKNDENIINKEYKFNSLNNELKENLLNINDFVKFENNEENVYIVLCNIKFDKKLLNNINLNNQINLNVNEIESKFIKKYSKVYNLIIINA